LFQIVEGYLAPNGKPYLFDKYIKEFKEEEFEKWKAFNERDCVYFSPDAMLYFINKESREFVSFLERKMVRGRSYLAKFLLYGVNNHQKELRI
jgi:hypothetical protein